MTDHQVIDRPDEYARALEAIASGEGPVAVDAERASGFRYSQRAYLIQVYRRGAGTFLFDPPALGRFDDLDSLLADEEWVLHAASQDLPCLREVGLSPHRLFDTELCARLLGMPRVGLASVVEELLGVHLAKEHSAADWSTRPLPPAWLTYAALDVELLIDLRERMGELLDEAGKTDIASQEFAAVLGKETKSPRAEPWRRLSGLHTLRGPRALAIARELWEARDALAKQRDIAPGRLIPDTSLVAAVRAQPESSTALAALREFTGRASRSDLDVWWKAIQRGRETTDLPAVRAAGDALPPPRSWSERNPEAAARLTAAREAVGETAEQLDIPVENVLTPEILRRLSWSPPEEVTAEAVGLRLADMGARPWQVEHLASRLTEVFVAARQLADAEASTGS